MGYIIAPLALKKGFVITVGDHSSHRFLPIFFELDLYTGIPETVSAFKVKRHWIEYLFDLTTKLTSG